MQNLISCPHCHYNRISKGFKICPKCGLALEEEVHVNLLKQINHQVCDTQLE